MPESIVRSLSVRLVGLGLVLSHLLLTGCGDVRDLGPTVQVTGKVTLDGKPFSEGAIRFVSPSKGAGPRANLNEDGTYALKIEDAQIGEIYGVFIAPVETDEEVLSEETADAPSAPIGPTPPPVPTKYMRAETSGLTAPIEKDEEHTFDFELKSN